MRKDQNYGHLVSPCIVAFDGVPVKRSEEIELAPAQYGYFVTTDEAVHAEHGNLPIIRTTESVASEGHELVHAGWEERDGAIYAVYEERELPPPPPRKWTPLTVMRGLKKAGLWEALTADMSQMDMYEFIACQYIQEDDPLFVAKRDALYETLGKARVDAFLDALEVEP